VNPKKSFYFWRVQVKSAHTVGADGGCSFRAHDHLQRSYTAEDIDALVAYARPMKAWYVMPVRVVEELKSLMLYPESRGKRSRFGEVERGVGGFSGGGTERAIGKGQIARSGWSAVGGRDPSATIRLSLQG